jgi:hypothetical protein
MKSLDDRQKKEEAPTGLKFVARVIHVNLLVRQEMLMKVQL